MSIETINPLASHDRLSTLGRWLRSARVLNAVTALAALLALLDIFAIYRATQGNPYPYWKNNTDFGGYIGASQAVLAGQNIYEYKPCPCNLLYGTTEIHDQYPYPPLFAELLIPIVLLGDQAARYIWLAISVLCIVGTVALLMRGFGTAIRWPWVALTLAVIGASHLIRNDLYHGQVNLLLVFLITLGLWLHAKGHPIAAGLIIGVPLVVKPFLGIVLIYFLWRRQWKTAFTIGLTSATLLVVSFIPPYISLGLPGVLHWLETSAYYSSHAIAARPDNYSWNGILLRLFSANYFTTPWVESDLLYRAISLGALALFAGLFGLAVPGRRAATRSPIGPAPLMLAEVGLLIGLTMTLGPMTEQDHLLMLTPGLAGVLLIAYQSYQSQSAQRGAWLAAAVAWVVFYMLLFPPIPLSYGLPPSSAWVRLTGASILLTARIGLMLLILTGLLARALRRERGGARGAAPA